MASPFSRRVDIRDSGSMITAKLLGCALGAAQAREKGKGKVGMRSSKRLQAGGDVLTLQLGLIPNLQGCAETGCSRRY